MQVTDGSFTRLDIFSIITLTSHNTALISAINCHARVRSTRRMRNLDQYIRTVMVTPTGNKLESEIQVCVEQMTPPDYHSPEHAISSRTLIMHNGVVEGTVYNLSL